MPITKGNNTAFAKGWVMSIKFYIKLLILIIIIIITLLVIVFIKELFRTPPKTFRIYYDNINSKILNSMSNQSLNIVEASFFEKKDVDVIHTKQSQVVGYLSLVEIGYWDTPLVSELHEEDYLLNESNEKMKSLSEKNYLGDLSSPHYREVLFKFLKSRILDKGMDGVFFDTLDWIDYYKDDERLYNKLTTGYKTFLIELRETYPDILVIQNRGFDSFKTFSNDYIDGILWENFKSPYIENRKDKIDDLKGLHKLAASKKIDVYAISFENENKNRTLARKLNWNFLFSQMKNRYSKWNIIAR